MSHAVNSYNKALQYLYGLQKHGIKFGLSRTTHLLDKLNGPDLKGNYIHIAGTNGKGSVATFAETILREAGYKVGLYTSPHLVRFTERFKINGQEMPPETAAGFIQELERVIVPHEPPTFFEATTAMALLYFDREKTDVSILEVGMGGRLDATNVVTPLVCGITNIGLEHRQYLGKHLLDIAREKAGIIKPGVDVVTGVTQPAVIHLMETLAKERGAPLWRVGKDIRYRSMGGRLHYKGINLQLRGAVPGLRGTFQARNACLSLGLMERLIEKGFSIPEQAMHLGLEKASWPGRLHVVQKEPLIILDGAHNPPAARALAASIPQEFVYRKLILVIGVMADKEIGTLLRQILPIADYVLFTRPRYERAATPEALSRAAKPFHPSGETVPTLSQAIQKARNMADPQDLILVTGSLFTVGEAMTCLDPERHKPDPPA